MKEEDTKTYCGESTRTVQISHPAHEPQTPGSTMENHKAPALPNPH